MKYCHRYKKALLVTLFSILFALPAFAQLDYQPYSYQFYQKLNIDVYSPLTKLHTSVKPYFIGDSSALRPRYDSLMLNNTDNRKNSWIHRVLFNGHIAEVRNKEFTFYFDYLTDIGQGRELNDSKTTYINTRGYEAGGSIGSRFFFFASGYENQGRFANYEQAYIQTKAFVPGQAQDRTVIGQTTVKNSSDWSYSTVLLGFQASNAIMLNLGMDKMFIGDGYRSVLLSDYSSSYPLFRLTADLGKNVRYMTMWAYLDDQNAHKFDLNTSGANNRRKWAVFHYVDWNVTNRASLGFFNALIAAETDDQGNRHGFDLNYINPLIFSSSIGPSSPITDHTLLGFNARYKVLDKTTVYGQLLFDNGSTTRNAYQLGFRGADLFKIKALNYLFEYNTADPYTYADQNPIVNYTQFSEPLGHPFGANFKEYLGILNYSIGKFDLQGQLNYATYGLNSGGINYGKDITLPDNVSVANGSTGQGLATTLKYAEGTIAYVLNPKYNLRVEVGALLRQEKNAVSDTKTTLITFGLRSSFRNLYHDF
ncbi:hypothetical protein BEL04_06750 [Mucilaginibacter sp. PPCGB 2223]|uniref:hypothetical protein n=1 Tax=Mucilaginibacter sp. PPCGB 2223 TaxID=1886027 RepID=UPI000826F66B|nr:hypothetical protein [Mucilaginibacter sp. PPCGB 2223]OCX53970.1 hypothetical protein BEL04_06750 [Mucilaginibacter sp. PPCGB 2223]